MGKTPQALVAQKKATTTGFLFHRSRMVYRGDILATQILADAKAFGKVVKKKILVTGAAGFIGSHLCDWLVLEGHDVVGVDIFPAIPSFRLTALSILKKHLWYKKITKKSPNFEFIRADLREVEEVVSLFKRYTFDEVYHLAANMGGIGYITQPITSIVSDNLRMDLNMLEACSLQKEKPRFLFSSSACIYPQQLQEDGSHLTNSNYRLAEGEAYPADPDSHYGWEKLTMERLCNLFHEEFALPVRIARFHNIYGPGIDYFSERSKAIGSLCRKALRYPKESFVIWGDGQQSRSFCYIRDLIYGLVKLMDSDWQEPINLGSEEIVTVADLAQRIIAISKKEIPLEFDTSKPQGVRHRNANIDLARRRLDWEPLVKLNMGLELTYNWIRLVEDLNLGAP